MKKFLGKEAYKKISLLYANYIENNEIESTVLDYYFLIIDEEERINLFNKLLNLGIIWAFGENREEYNNTVHHKAAYKTAVFFIQKLMNF